MRGVRVLVIAAAVFACCACSFQPPKPWQKGALAKPEMTMAGDVLELKLNEHTYTTKEAASGGFGVGGGGCGCN
jgi:hypothetical protein